MKKLFLLLTIPACIALTSCGDGTEGEVVSTDSVPAENDALDSRVYFEYDMTPHGVEYGTDLAWSIMVPNKDRASADPMVEYASGSMITTLQVGKHYIADIMDLEPDKALKKEDLKNDHTFTNSIIEETDDVIIYESKAKDMEQTFFHFWMAKEINGLEYTIEDNKFGEFTKVHVEAMIKSLKTIKSKVVIWQLVV